MSIPLAEVPIASSIKVTPDHAGRQMRVFVKLLGVSVVGGRWNLRRTGRPPYVTVPSDATYGIALKAVQACPEVAETFAGLSLRMGCEPYLYLHDALQDLADEFIEDVTEACAALVNPDHFYPGIDDGIEPVADAHIEQVIAAMQPELNRERRDPWPSTSRNGSNSLPAVPLASLPHRIQRAIVERRRLRFLQYGVDKRAWERDAWSVWNVAVDPDFVPRRKVS